LGDLLKIALAVSKMNQQILHQGNAEQPENFPYVTELVKLKIQNVQLNTFVVGRQEGIKIGLITEGKFEWSIDGQAYTLFPGDASITFPWQEIGGTKGNFDIGALTWITIKPQVFEPSGMLSLGHWSSISVLEQRVIGTILTRSKTPILSRFGSGAEILNNLEYEILHQEIGYRTRINHLLDELLINIVRHLNKADNFRRDFPQIFLKLEQTLRENLAYPWTVEEMAGLVGLGTTAFAEKVKGFTGFSPLNYLINLRIGEAIKLMAQPHLSLTDIALDTGFYSSQHFSTTFKKITGYTPRAYRKKQ
jgi:AraC-like DNA-binding protein